MSELAKSLSGPRANLPAIDVLDDVRTTAPSSNFSLQATALAITLDLPGGLKRRVPLVRVHPVEDEKPGPGRDMSRFNQGVRP